MALYNPLLPSQGTLGQSPTVPLPKVVIPGTTPTPTTGTKPTIDKVFDFLGNLAGTLFPSGLGGTTQPPVYYPTVPTVSESALNPITILLGVGVLYLLTKK